MPSLARLRGLLPRGATVAIALVWCAGTGAAPAVASNASPLAISPAPGTPDASPDTQISILGPAPSTIRTVSVDGSLSGVHSGRLLSYRGARGASFVLRHPLTQGERVAVRISFRGRRRVAFSFTVARLAPMPPVITANTEQPAKLDHFVSAPVLLAPRIKMLRSGAQRGGDIFLTPLPSPIIHPESQNVLTIKPVGPGGPMIINSHGQLVWFDQLDPPEVATDLRPQRFEGREVLTWWQGEVTLTAFGVGVGVIANRSYRIVKTVRAGNGYFADLHEFVLTPAGSALFTVYSPVMVHLPGSPAGTLSPVLDSLVQEVDVRTGLVEWEWHALGHIPLADSYATQANSSDFDAYHLNSIQLLGHGRVLVSARDTSAVYLIDQASGHIVWTLGGKASSFRLGRGAGFFLQHDAQLLPGNRVSLFDDEGGPPFKAPASRGLILALNSRSHTARLLKQYTRPGDDTLADSEGSLQLVPGGNVFAGFGSQGFFSQFTAGGRLLLDGALPLDDGSYRVFRYPWSATPTSRPALAASRISPTRVVLYASWNGATSVARWRVLSGRRRLTAGPTVAARGFETRIVVNGRATRFAVSALSASSARLASSATVSAQ